MSAPAALAVLAAAGVLATAAGAEPPLDHDDFGLNQSKIIVIDSKSLERDWREKPAPTFSHPALILVAHVYGEINDEVDLDRVYSQIRADVDQAEVRADLTPLYRRARYLVTLTYAPGWRKKFGADAPHISGAAKDAFRTTVAAINHRAREIGTEPDYDDQ